MHAQWARADPPRVTAGAADAALDAIAAAAIDEDVHAVSEEEEEDDDDGWGEWGDEGGESEAKTAQVEKRSGSKTGAVVSEMARSLLVAAARPRVPSPPLRLRSRFPTLPFAPTPSPRSRTWQMRIWTMTSPRSFSAPRSSPRFCPRLRAVRRLRAGADGSRSGDCQDPYAVASPRAAPVHAAAGTLAMSAAGLHLGARDERRGRGGAGEVPARAQQEKRGRRRPAAGASARANRRSVRGKCAGRAQSALG